MYRPLVVSNSDRTTFKNCRRKWDLSSPNRRNLRPIAKQRPLWLGSLVHECLEHYYLGNDKDTYRAFLRISRDIPEEEKEDYAAELIMAEVMMQHYALVYPNLEDEPFEVIGTEIPFQIPVVGGVISGTIDGLIRWKASKTIGCLEHKTFSMHKDVTLHGIDDQTRLYPAAANMLIKQGMIKGVEQDEFCDSVLYNGLWKKIPAEYKLLKNGAPSKMNENLISTPQWVLHSMKMLGKNTSNMVDKLDDLKHNVEKFFPRWEIHRSEKEQKLAVNSLLAEFADMKELSKLPYDAVQFYHNPTTECSWKCAFTKVCEFITRGEDYQHLIDEKFEVAPSRGEAYEMKGNE